jgi:DNA recombination protein RmuC
MEDYLRLVESCEKMDNTEIMQNQKALIKRIKDEAKSIKEKYISIPKTTDFAIMYLPTEGLYAEVAKCNGLIEQLQRDYKIIICGPTTISALLNSLQLGFKTIAIEKRSSEIWQMLATFKKEFAVYVELLGKTHKKLNEATDTIENATKKSEKIQKQLSKMDDLGIELNQSQVSIIQSGEEDE